MREDLKLFRYLKNNTGLIVIFFFCIAVYTATTFSIAWVFKTGYEQFLPTGASSALFKMVTFVIGISVLRLVSYYLMDYIALTIRFRVRHNLRFDLLKHVLETEYSFFHFNTAGSIVNRLIPETDLAADAIVKTCEAAVNLIQIIASATYLMLLDFLLGCCYLSIFVCAFGLLLFYHKRIEDRQRELSGTMDHFYGFFYSYFSTMKEIKCYNMLGFQKDILQGIMDDERRNNFALMRAKSVMDLTMTVPGLLGMGFLFVWGFYKLDAGFYSYGTLLVMIFLLSVLYQPMMNFSAALSTIQMGRAAIGKVTGLFGSVTEQKSGAKLQPVHEAIRLNHLSFSYLPEMKVLKDINIDFSSDTFTVIVGESGSGKTTLVNLLLRLYTVTDGGIKIDGNDINTIGVDSLREHIGIVSQESMMLDGTLRENIDVNAKLSDGEVLELCREAGLNDLVDKLPDGIHTQLADAGQSLSGGEKQRVALARCLAKKVQVMILDEATSALDLNTEECIIGTLLELCKTRHPFMIIAITHRPSFARYADRIIVLENGAVVESGTHAELLAGKKAYFTLFSNSESNQAGGSI